MSQADYKVQELARGRYSLKKYDGNIGEFVGISRHLTHADALAAIPGYEPAVPSAKTLAMRALLAADLVRARASDAMELANVN